MTPFTSKNWEDLPATTTPISAAALEDIERRLSDYTDTRATGLTPFTVARNAASHAIFGAQFHVARYDASADTTFVMYLGPQHDLWATGFNHATNELLKPRFVQSALSTMWEDSHGVPSMTIDPSGYIHVLWGVHQALPMYARSLAPRRIDAGWATSQLSVALGTYHTLECNPANGHLFAVFRAGESVSATYPGTQFGGLLTSTNGGSTWSVISGGVVDTGAYPDGDTKFFYPMGVQWFNGRYWFAFFIAWQTSGSYPTRSNFYMAGYDPADGNLYTIGGTSLGPLISGSSELDACRIHQVDNLNMMHFLFKANGNCLASWNEYGGNTTLGSDTFTGTAASNLAVHTADTGGFTWAKKSGWADDLLLTGDGAIYGSGAANFAKYVANVTPDGPDYGAEIDFTIDTVLGSVVLDVRSNPAGSAGYNAIIDVVAGTLTVNRVDSAGVSTAILGPTGAAGMTIGTSHTLSLQAVNHEKGGVTLVTVVDGNIFSIIDRASTRITAAYLPAIRLRNSTATTGVNVTAFRFQRYRAMSVRTSLWNGTAWTVGDVGARTNHSYTCAAPYLKSDGSWEMYAPTGREGERPVIKPLAGDDDTILYRSIGSDVTRFTSPDGINWTRQEAVLTAEMTHSQGLLGAVPVVDATSELKVLSMAAVSSGPVGSSGSYSLPIYGIGDGLSASVAARLFTPSSMEQEAPYAVAVSGQTAAGSLAYTLLNLDDYVPHNCTWVELRVTCTGDGTAGTEAAFFARPRGSSRTQGDMELRFAATENYAHVVRGWTQLGAFNQIEWAASNMAASSIMIGVIGFRTG